MSGCHRVEPHGQMPIRLVAAHPDDLESRCAGTLVPAIAEEATVRLLLLTSGEKRSKVESGRFGGQVPARPLPPPPIDRPQRSSD
jgi:LmbE family N-acetylglucosaminyl deacetylase